MSSNITVTVYYNVPGNMLNTDINRLICIYIYVVHCVERIKPILVRYAGENKNNEEL